MSPKIYQQTIPVQYQKGSLKILINLPLKEGEKFEIQIIKPEKISTNKSRSLKFKEALEKSFGAIPDLPEGVKYTNKIRNEWEKDLKRKWHE